MLRDDELPPLPDASALTNMRKALAAGPTPGEWSLKTVPTSDGSCHKIGPFPSASRIHSEAHACVYAIGIRLGIDDSTPVARELLANARLMAACSPANIAAILAHVEAQAAENERLTAECDEAREERDAMRAALNTIARTPAMPFPDPGAHSERAYHEAVFVAWSRSNQTARAALAQIEQEKANGSR